MSLRLLAGCVCLGYASLATAMFCPTNFNQINLGDTFEMVESKCGIPASQKTSKEENPNVPQEWTYYVTMPTDPFESYGSVKITVAFVDTKVVNISSGGYSVGATTLCGQGNNIQMGSTMDQVKAACGKAVMITKAAVDPGSPEAQVTEIVEWKYNSTPPVTLRFTNGKLSSRQ